MGDNVIPLEMTSPTALRIIRETAKDTSRVIFTKHAKKQMRRRRLNRTQIYSCLRRGVITEGPYLDSHGYWRSTMCRLAAGEEIAVVVSFRTRDSLIIVSAM